MSQLTEALERILNWAKKNYDPAMKISKYKMPKYWFEVEGIPRCDRGKINYRQISEIAAKRRNINRCHN